MKTLKTILTLFTFFISSFAFTQQMKPTVDFSIVDSLARTLEYRGDIFKLTKDLISPYSEDVKKVRAIFIWITENIRYDYKFYNKKKEIMQPECRGGMNCEQLYLDWERKYLGKVLKKKKAICDGYAKLFKKMCDIAGLKSEIVTGYTKTKPSQIGLTGFVDHGWNAVWIDSAYYQLDATWAAGYCEEDEETGNLLNFQKSYNDYYWLTPFPDLARDHYPKESKWVLQAGYTKEKYAANPFYAADILSKINLLSPASGIITVHKGDTVHFKFEYTGNISYLQINSNLWRNPTVWRLEKASNRKSVWQQDTFALKKQQYVPFKREGNVYAFEYVVPDNSLYYLDVLFNHQRKLRFKVKTEN